MCLFSCCDAFNTHAFLTLLTLTATEHLLEGASKLNGERVVEYRVDGAVGRKARQLVL